MIYFSGFALEVQPQNIREPYSIPYFEMGTHKEDVLQESTGLEAVNQSGTDVLKMKTWNYLTIEGGLSDIFPLIRTVINLSSTLIFHLIPE